MRTGLNKLYEFAANEKIFVFFGKIGFTPAVTIKDSGYFNVAIDPRQVSGEGEERTVLMHELSHVATGTFYKATDDTTYKRRMECRATRWQIEFMIPRDRLREALDHGYTELWDLADFFEVSEDLMAKAVEYYKMTT